MQTSPMYFEIGYDEFDLDLIAEEAREIGSEPFREAVRAYFEAEFADLDGTIHTEFDHKRIKVTWMPNTPVDDLLEHAIQRLTAGDIEGGLPFLQALASVEPNNPTAHYNLGMALSDLGQFERAQWHLLKAVRVEPANGNALTALGVALYRSGDPQAAQRRLEQALDVQPNNGYAHRNLAAVLMALGDMRAGIDHFREAYRLLPDDQQSVFGLASALDQFGTDEDEAEADRLYVDTIEVDPRSPIAEMAREARSHIAQKHMRRAAGSGPRMDAVMYCLGALEKFGQMSPSEVQAIAYEIAMVGQQGIDVNSAEQKYTLQSLPGSYSGLHLMSYMYVAFKQISPSTDIGFDLAQEYETALEMHEKRRDRA